ncbi:DNA polymerase ligase N-terminal domain-containing protein [Nitrospira defluvii]|uniref:LigD_N domain-containing protein n=1 Tax=Nitrospira defluvii TaxID=330214 RepID=A0ABM8RLH8_9BACT|nr:DNA polymerase ligase N-terminal domain-containing protein [Nitrospira defluvii]CAE6759605.1 LigD_N domain-containing protein [Nitrospira defluvii]
MKKPLFIVHKHRATHLHYDLRLEIGGVLASWAVPKGPSLDPGIKRLAIQVEDHDLAYADFEGVIEEGGYGAGPVLVWDRGWFEPSPRHGETGSAAEMLHEGVLDVRFHGRRLNGRFSLVRMKGRQGQWLLIKQEDDAARPGSDITVEQQQSVLTNRSIEELAEEAAAGTLATLAVGSRLNE